MEEDISVTDGVKIPNDSQNLVRKSRIAQKYIHIRVAEVGSLSSGGKNGRENFRQTRIYNVRDKCVVFAHNLKFLSLTQ